MISTVYSHWQRTKRTPARYVAIFCPVVYGVLFGVYNSFSSVMKGNEFGSFFSVFAVLSLFSMSFFVPMIYEPDREAGFYANELRSPLGRKRNFMGKFALISIMFFIIELIATAVYVIILYLFRGESADIKYITAMFLLGLCTMLPMILVYQVFTLKYSYSGSIILGCFAVLASLLLGTTNLGDAVWKGLPFIWNLRINYLLAKGIMSLDSTGAYIVYSLAITAVLAGLCTLWYNGWEAKVKMEE